MVIFSAVVPVVLKALAYDEKRGSYSVGKLDMDLFLELFGNYNFQGIYKCCQVTDLQDVIWCF